MVPYAFSSRGCSPTSPRRWPKPSPACFNGKIECATYVLDRGVNPEAGNGTGMNAAHWAVNRGKLDTIRLLLFRNVPLETTNMYGGTVLSTAVWSVIHEPWPDHFAIIKALVAAGARLDGSGYPTGDVRVDELLRRLGTSV